MHPFLPSERLELNESSTWTKLKMMPLLSLLRLLCVCVCAFARVYVLRTRMLILFQGHKTLRMHSYVYTHACMYGLSHKACTKKTVRVVYVCANMHTYVDSQMQTCSGRLHRMRNVYDVECTACVHLIRACIHMTHIRLLVLLRDVSCRCANAQISYTCMKIDVCAAFVSPYIEIWPRVQCVIARLLYTPFLCKFNVGITYERVHAEMCTRVISKPFIPTVWYCDT
jgi:hypothetical protein